MAVVYLEESACNDLDELWERDEDAAAFIEIALDEIQHDPRLYERLHEIGYRNVPNPSFEVDWFSTLQNDRTTRLNLYRLKFWDPEGALSSYRVIYAYHNRNDSFHVLAVVPRNFNYDRNHPIVKRVCADYERLDIPSY
jgi:mRNA-degrading endonuclease RelE of RelBE toxin-antitoxin system